MEEDPLVIVLGKLVEDLSEARDALLRGVPRSTVAFMARLTLGQGLRRVALLEAFLPEPGATAVALPIPLLRPKLVPPPPASTERLSKRAYGSTVRIMTSFTPGSRQNAKAVAQATGIEIRKVRQRLWELQRDKRLVRVGYGLYALPAA